MRFAELVFVLLLPGCYLSHELGEPVGGRDGGRVDGGRADAGRVDAGHVDAGPPHDSGPLPDIPCIPIDGGAPRPVDVLFVVDDSPSMVEEQAALAMQIPIFVSALATGDADGDHTPDFEPVRDMHMGVITVNMGVAGIPHVPTCMESPDFGDDGVLLTVPRLGGTACMMGYPHFLTFVAGVTDPVEFATDMTCLARTGAHGCGFEQQLDAMLKALLPSSDPTTFAEGTHGHGDERNAGFLRASSVLAVLMLTDEDDCSTNVIDIWNPLSASHTGDLNLRCINYGSELYPVDRFIDGLHSLRPEAPNDVVLLAITGVPPELATGTVIDYDALFADPRMQNHITIIGGTSSLDPACQVASRGAAAPGIRVARVAQGLGASGLVQSICASDFQQSLSWLAGFAGRRACAAP